MKKRILSLLLALIMVLQYVPGEVFAQTDGKLISNHPSLTGTDQGYTIDASRYSSEASAKTISILGDSISTYQNWSNGTASQTTNSTITNGEIYYPRSGFSVTAESTWWYQAAQMLDLEILVNNSWSGSCLLNTRSGTVGAYVDRCIQLHDDTGENAGQKPDIIAIYLGTNDYYTYSGMLGSFEAIDFAALIQKTESSFRYAQPATSLEAYAIILHKIAQAYPDAEVYCFTLLPRVNSSSQPTAFNTDVCQLAEYFGVNTVDLFDCGIQKESTAFYKLMGDNLHPNDPGMDAITNAFVSAVLKNSGETTYDVSFALDGAVALEGTTRTVMPGDAFEAALAAVSASNVLEVTVTMDGTDITESCWDGNRISVPKVTGNISVTAVGKEKPQEPENTPVIDRQLTNFRWELRNNTLENVTDDQNSANGLTMTQGSISGGVTNNVRYTLDKTIYLNHDQPWSVEWQSSGTWGNDGGLLFAQSTASNTTRSRYLYRRCSNSMFALGVHENGTYHNYAVEFAGTGIDTTKTHVFRLTNRIAPDGSNMIWLHVDDTEVGPLNQYWNGGTDKNTTSNWLSGKNFQFSYMGTQQHPLTSCTIDYVQVWETGTDTPPSGPEEGGQIPPVEPEDWTPADYRWELKDNALVSITTDGNTANDLIRTQGSVSNGVHSGGRYTLTQSIKLYHDRPWVLEWKSEGSWANSMQGAMLFAQSNSSSGSGYYFYRRSDTDPKAFFGFGECKGGVWYNYGITLSQYGIDDKVLHTYRLVNRIAEDNNMVYLYVDDAEIGPLNGYNVNGSNKGTTSNWVSGKDFAFHYMGTDRHTLDNCTIHYIQVWENGPHIHSYEATVTAPTCTEQGYTTYVCACGDSYVADYVDTVWHSYQDGRCAVCSCDMLRVTSEDMTRYQGGVNSENGTLNTTFTNNWYTDIRIPKGAEQVRVLTFKTGANWGSAFFEGAAYLSGFCDPKVGGQWITVDIPKNATLFRYGYLYDEIAKKNGLPLFEYLEFVGAELETGESSQYLERPASGCHSFFVDVNIAPAQGNPGGYVHGTDYGYIQLPTSYSSYGDPTRLIIVCHGAGAKLSDYRSNSWKNTNYAFWTDLGYAVMDMYASPAELANGSELHYGNPVVVDCYKSGYEYVMKHFNLKQDGIYVIGSSMGGLSSFQIVQSGEFPVLAQVGYCPVIDLFKQAYCNPWTTASYQRERIASYFGFAGTKPTFTNGKYPSAGEIEFYRQNFGKTLEYSPILRNVTKGDAASIFDVIPGTATATDAAEAALYGQLTATHPCPLMIFHNTDDSTVSYRYSQYFVDMVSRSGQEARLYTFTSGNHNAWANGESVTVPGINGQITIKESQYEAYLFFNKLEQHTEHYAWVDPAVDATCISAGLTEGKHCASCGEILVKQTVSPATGVHNYENGICTGCCIIKEECIWQVLDNGTVVGAYAQLQEAMDACENEGIILLAADSGWIEHASADKNITIVFGGSAADDYAHTCANGTCSVCGDMIEGTAL